MTFNSFSTCEPHHFYQQKSQTLCSPGIHFSWKQSADLCGSTEQSLKAVISVRLSCREARRGPAEPHQTTRSSRALETSNDGDPQSSPLS